ncbi:hypothetical protein [Nitrospira sp. Kam-Ns4a]
MAESVRAEDAPAAHSPAERSCATGIGWCRDQSSRVPFTTMAGTRLTPYRLALANQSARF